MNIILASKSPRRKEILQGLFTNFKVVHPKFKEKIIYKNNPSNSCINLSKGKAISVAKDFPNYYIIAADTIVYLENKILGKPKNKSEAKNYLKLLSNKTHEVYTGVSIINKNKNICKSFFDKTIVCFNEINSKEISFYIDNYKPFDKAGAYGIQDWSKIFIKKINGCFYNVVGFPLPKFYKLFADDLNLINKDK